MKEDFLIDFCRHHTMLSLTLSWEGEGFQKCLKSWNEVSPEAA